MGVIDKKLDAIIAELALIKTQQTLIIADIRDVARSVQSNFADSTARLGRIESQLNAVRGEYLTSQWREEQKNFEDSVDFCKSAIRNKDWVDRPGSFRDQLTQLYGFAIRAAKLPSMTGDPNFSPTLTSYAQALRTRGYVDLSFGLLSVGVSLLGFTIPHQADYEVPSPEIYANPLCWAMGCNAYLEARMVTPTLLTRDDQSYLPILWDEGMRLNDVVSACTKKSLKLKLVQLMEPLAGVRLDGQRLDGGNFISIVEQAVQSFQENELTPPYKLDLFRSWTIPNGATVYGTGPESSYTTVGKHPGRQAVRDTRNLYRVTNDPLDLLIASQIIERINVPFTESSEGPQFPRTASQLKITSGPRAGQFLGGPDSRLFETDYTAYQSQPHRHRAWNPLASYAFGQDPRPLMDECFALVRTEIDYKKVTVVLADRIRSAVQGSMGTSDSSIVAMLNDFMIMSRAFAVLAQWCRTWSNDGALSAAPTAARFDNLLAPDTVNVLVDDLGTYIRLQLPPSVDYVAPVVKTLTTATAQMIVTTVAPMNGDDADSLSLHFVQMTLKRLAGYMQIRDIQFKRPTAIAQYSDRIEH